LNRGGQTKKLSQKDENSSGGREKKCRDKNNTKGVVLESKKGKKRTKQNQKPQEIAGKCKAIRLMPKPG